MLKSHGWLIGPALITAHKDKRENAQNALLFLRHYRFFFIIVVELSSPGLWCFEAIKGVIVFAKVQATHKALVQILLYIYLFIQAYLARRETTV